MVNMADPVRPIFVYIPQRNQETLTAVIEEHIPHGSTIVSDCWRGYNNLNNYQHLTVNHTRNFVDPNTGKI